MKQPENIVAVKIDPVSGLLANTNQPNAIIEYFRNNEVPKTDDSSTAITNTEPDTIENPKPSENNQPTEVQENLF